MVAGTDDCLKAVREQVANGADWIKIYVDWPFFIDKDGGISGLTNFTREELTAMVNEAQRLVLNIQGSQQSRGWFTERGMKGIPQNLEDMTVMCFNRLKENSIMMVQGILHRCRILLPKR